MVLESLGNIDIGSEFKVGSSEASSTTCNTNEEHVELVPLGPKVHDEQPGMPTSMAAPMDADAYNITSCNSSGR